MNVALSLVVLRCSNVEASRRFYEAFGLTFREEQHEGGPAHWSCDLDGVVLELYPAGERSPSVGRLGLVVDDLPSIAERLSAAGVEVAATSDDPGRVVVVDPDGTRVELTQRGTDSDPTRWSVWRQDDNGNRAVVSGGHSREEAERRLRELEAKGHKQMYWVSE